MQDEPTLGLPFGMPVGPVLSTTDLLRSYLAGASSGCSTDAHIEYRMLLARDIPLAVRLDDVVLVRDEVPEAARRVQLVLWQTLRAHGMNLVERQSVLASAAALELAVPRGYEWDLWARDARRARHELVRQALSEVADFVESESERLRAEVGIDAVLRELERDW